MSIRSVTARGQRASQATMLDTCKITKPGTGGRVFDEDTGEYADPARVTVYEGPCRMQVKADINSNVVETTAGEHEWTYLTSSLQLPVGDDPRIVTGSSADVAVDHIAEWLTCPDDPNMEGRLFNITGPFHKSQAVYRRFRVREVVA